jgi:hypothetical protein
MGNEIAKTGSGALSARSLTGAIKQLQLGGKRPSKDVFVDALLRQGITDPGQIAVIGAGSYGTDYVIKATHVEQRRKLLLRDAQEVAPQTPKKTAFVRECLERGLTDPDSIAQKGIELYGKGYVVSDVTVAQVKASIIKAEEEVEPMQEAQKEEAMGSKRAKRVVAVDGESKVDFIKKVYLDGMKPADVMKLAEGAGLSMSYNYVYKVIGDLKGAPKKKGKGGRPKAAPAPEQQTSEAAPPAAPKPKRAPAPPQQQPSDLFIALLDVVAPQAREHGMAAVEAVMTRVMGTLRSAFDHAVEAKKVA